MAMFECPKCGERGRVRVFMTVIQEWLPMAKESEGPVGQEWAEDGAYAVCSACGWETQEIPEGWYPS